MVSPDVGGVARARAFAKKLSDAPLAIVDKRRHGHNVAEVKFSKIKKDKELLYLSVFDLVLHFILFHFFLIFSGGICPLSPFIFWLLP